METLTIAQAARHLGLSDQGVRKMIDRQELFILSGTTPVKLPADQVETARLLRREALLLDLAAKRRTPVMLAQEVRGRLFPPNDPGVLPQYVAAQQRLRLSLLPAEARQLFGVAALSASLVQDKCRWCSAQDFAKVLGGWAPDAYSEGFAALFDQQPCERCGPGLYAAVLASLEARVHPGRQRPPDPVAEAVAAERVAALACAPEAVRPVAKAQPVQGDDGRGLVAARLRTARARLKDAKRRGDKVYALRLATMIRELERDAAVVDGRVTASARPGTLRCGHLLAAGCSCPRRASKRATS